MIDDCSFFLICTLLRTVHQPLDAIIPLVREEKTNEILNKLLVSEKFSIASSVICQSYPLTKPARTLSQAHDE